MGQSQSGQEAVCFRANQSAAKVFGQRSRSGTDEIREEQTGINTSPQTHTHAHTEARTLVGIFFYRLKSAEEGKSG